MSHSSHRRLWKEADTVPEVLVDSIGLNYWRVQLGLGGHVFYTSIKTLKGWQSSRASNTRWTRVKLLNEVAGDGSPSQEAISRARVYRGQLTQHRKWETIYRHALNSIYEEVQHALSN